MNNEAGYTEAEGDTKAHGEDEGIGRTGPVQGLRGTMITEGMDRTDAEEQAGAKMLDMGRNTTVPEEDEGGGRDTPVLGQRGAQFSAIKDNEEDGERVGRQPVDEVGANDTTTNVEKGVEVDNGEDYEGREADPAFATTDSGAGDGRCGDGGGPEGTRGPATSDNMDGTNKRCVLKETEVGTLGGGGQKPIASEDREGAYGGEPRARQPTINLDLEVHSSGSSGNSAETTAAARLKVRLRKKNKKGRRKNPTRSGTMGSNRTGPGDTSGHWATEAGGSEDEETMSRVLTAESRGRGSKGSKSVMKGSGKNAEHGAVDTSSGEESAESDTMSRMLTAAARAEARKKKKKTKRKRKAANAKARAKASQSTEGPRVPAHGVIAAARPLPIADKAVGGIASSLLRQGKFSTNQGASKGATIVAPPALTHDHVHKRVVLEAAVLLSADDKHAEFTDALRILLTNFQKVDPLLVLSPINATKDKPIFYPADLPYNLTDQSAHIQISGGDRTFEMKQPYRNGGYSDDPADLRDPVVYLALAFSSDVEPEDILQRVRHEWTRMNGQKIYIKSIPSFQTETPVAIYRMFNMAHHSTIVAELTLILYQARDAEAAADSDFAFHSTPVPHMGVRLNVPKIPGQDTSVFNDWPRKLKDGRRVIHIECSQADSPIIKRLVAIAKERDLVSPLWGKQAHLSETISGKTKPGDVSNMGAFVQKHVNYHATMIYNKLIGIVALDKAVPFYSASDPTTVKGSFTLRAVLYRFISLADKHSLFAEIHQEMNLASVDVVIPNTPEAETMITMMNRQLGAYLHFTLTDAGLGGTFIKDLLRFSICPALLHEIPSCKWDATTKVLTTPKTQADAKRSEIEDAAWYKDEYGAHMTESGRKEKKNYANKDMLYDLDKAQSVTTIHARPGGTYAGTPGADTLDLGSKSRKGKDIEADDVSLDLSALSELSKAELLEIIRKKKSALPRSKGSAPIDLSRPQSETNEDASSSSNESDSDSSSTSSDGESSTGSSEASGG